MRRTLKKENLQGREPDVETGAYERVGCHENL